MPQLSDEELLKETIQTAGSTVSKGKVRRKKDARRLDCCFTITLLISNTPLKPRSANACINEFPHIKCFFRRDAC